MKAIGGWKGLVWKLEADTRNILAVGSITSSTTRVHRELPH